MTNQKNTTIIIYYICNVIFCIYGGIMGLSDGLQEFLDATIGQWEYLVRMVVAVLCGALVGLERSKRQKEAGIRTHIIVSLGAALLMIVSKYGFFDVVIYDSIQLDASRLASNIITSIGFLGAGVIFLKGGSVKGLTTSAGLWTIAGVGTAIGAGLYTVGLFAAGLVILIQFILHRYNLSSETISSNEILIRLEDDNDIINSIKKKFVDRNILVQEFSLKRNEDSTVTLLLTVKMNENVALEELLTMAHEIPQIKEVSVTT